jgi:hypothetical protein
MGLGVGPSLSLSLSLGGTAEGMHAPRVAAVT